jgi:hypothetical protein
LFENGKEYFAGSWRNENETWVFIRDVTTCTCYPACAKCSEKVPGTVNMRRVMTGAQGAICLSEFNVKEDDCDWSIRGVSGGAIVYYEEPRLPTGEFQKCFSYATITGARVMKAVKKEVKVSTVSPSTSLPVVAFVIVLVTWLSKEMVSS